MKLLLAALCGFFMSVASAEEIEFNPGLLYMPNASDGYLTLTNEPCEIAAQAAEFPHKATNEDDQGNVMTGCWKVDQESPEGAFKVVQVYMVELGSGNVGVFNLKLFGVEKKRWTEETDPQSKVEPKADL